MFNLRSVGGSGYDLELQPPVQVRSGNKETPNKHVVTPRGDVFLRYNGVEYPSTHQKHAGDRFIGYDRHMALGIDAEPVTVTDILKGIFQFFSETKSY